jgi:restriction system protein
MARSFLSTVTAVAREVQRAERARMKEALRRQSAVEREARKQERFERVSYVASRERETQARNEQLNGQTHELQHLLIAKLDHDPTSNFKKLVRVADELELDGDESLKLPENPNLKNYLPPPPNLFVRWGPGVAKKFRRATKDAKERYDAAELRYEEIKQQRADRFFSIQKEVEHHNNALVDLTGNYPTQADTVVAYFRLVLELSAYPDVFPRHRKLAYMRESKQLAIEFELPTLDKAVPPQEKYRYVKKTDEIVEVKRSEKSRQEIYSTSMAQAVLRCLYEVFRADSCSAVDTVVLNAHVFTLNPATGRAIRPCLISVRTSRDHFLGFDLRYVDAITCLKELKAAVSKHPGELIPVKPILDFNMIDLRFVVEADVLSTLDQRPNLMELSPSEFESLITNLFAKMGLDTKLTQASRDGGVDCVAYDARPILGGKVVIQAKRYKNTVGVGSVRDLYGTLHNEGASKGILVATSGFGKAAYDFANGKPIELITGSNLLYLLKEHADIDAKIEMPPDWIDPSGDTGSGSD